MNEQRVVGKAYKDGAAIEYKPRTGSGVIDPPWLDAGDHVAVWGFLWDSMEYRVVPSTGIHNPAPRTNCSPESAAAWDAAFPPPVSDITFKLMGLLRTRDATGLKKYNKTLDRTDLTPEEWLQHMTEELLDGAGYAQCLLREIAAMRAPKVNTVEVREGDGFYLNGMKVPRVHDDYTINYPAHMQSLTITFDVDTFAFSPRHRDGL